MRTSVCALVLALAPVHAFAQAYPAPPELPAAPAPPKVDAPKVDVSKGAALETRHTLGMSFGATVAEGSSPFGGGAAMRLFGGTRVAERVFLEFAASYVDYFSRPPLTTTGNIFSFSIEARFELPLVGEWLRFFGRGGGHYSVATSFFQAQGVPDFRDRASGPGFVFGGGFRFRLWRNPKDGASFFLGAEFGSLWIFQQADSASGPTVMNTLSMPISVAW